MNHWLRKLLIILTIFVLVFTTRGFSFNQMNVKAGNTSGKDIPENTLRIHYQNEENKYQDLGLWLWEDVESPTANWPQGAAAFEEENQDEYGTYIDIPLKEDARKVSFLVVNRTNGEKESGDKSVTINNPSLNEIWIKDRKSVV